MMSYQFTAFTTKSNGRLRELSTEVIVTPAREAISGNEELPQVKAKAVWDTGATTTCISSKLVDQLKMIPVSKAKIRSVDKESVVNVYFVDIILPNNAIITSVPVSEPEGLYSCDVLIGMDIINFGDFTITNANNETWFSFRTPPDLNHIDYVEQAKKVQYKAERRKRNKKKRKK
jgi:hypothetical protein